MARLISLALALSVGIVSFPAYAQEDPILTRKKLMQANGAVFYGMARRMIQGEIPFNPVLAAAVVRTSDAVAHSFGDYFPEGSDQGDTRASPAIWEEMEEFQQYLADFQAAAGAAREADPQTLEAFTTAMEDLGETCDACHDEFRLEGD